MKKIYNFCCKICEYLWSSDSFFLLLFALLFSFLFSPIIIPFSVFIGDHIDCDVQDEKPLGDDSHCASSHDDKFTCDYCGSTFDTSVDKCVNCGSSIISKKN